MGLFMTLEGLTEEDAVRLASEEAVPADRLRVFDLHCDTLDRLAFHGDASVPGGFAAHDARIPAHRMATLADNDAHVSLARTEGSPGASALRRSSPTRCAATRPGRCSGACSPCWSASWNAAAISWRKRAR